MYRDERHKTMKNATQPALTRTESTVRTLFLLALFSVSFSTALTNLFVGLAYIGFVFALFTSAPLRRVLRSPPGLLALALLALFVIGTSWSIAPREEMLMALKKYSRLMILPIGIALSWRDPALSSRALRWFLGGAGVLAAACYLTRFGMMPTSSLGWWRVSQDANDAYVFRNHITIGILLGFATSASLLIASYAATPRARLAAIGAAVFFAVPIMILGQGRTGYVTLFIGLVTVLLLHRRATPLLKVAGIGAIALVFFGAYLASPNVKLRTDALIDEVTTGALRTPNGLRMSFMRVGMEVVAANPLLGVGTGSFAEAYAPTNRSVWPAGSPESEVRNQPHSEFLLVAVQLGLAGLALYFAMLFTLGSAALGPRSFETDSLALLWVIYFVASSFNSLLWDTTEAHWFLLLGSCLYVGARRRRMAEGLGELDTISLIVTTYNRPDALEAVVEGCFAQTDRNFEIIIADDGSGEATRETVARLAARSPVPLQHVWQPDVGFRLAMSRNGGIAAARGQYLVIIDGDCVPQRDFLARHRKLAQRGYMVTGSRILVGPEFTQKALAGKIALYGLGLGQKLRLRAAGHINKVLQLLFSLPDIGRAKKRFSYRRIKGCNMAMWRSDVELVNGFDASFSGWGYEDSDMVLRLFNAGVMRKDGAFATEVFHLWHNEAQRDQASSNRMTVQRREADGTTQAASGLRDAG
jgi:O-antigen ligase